MTMLYHVYCPARCLDRADWGGCRPTKSARTAGSSPFDTMVHIGDVAVDVLEWKEAYELVADVPGFDIGDILVELHDKVLTVSGTLQQAEQQQTAAAADQDKEGKQAVPEGAGQGTAEQQAPQAPQAPQQQSVVQPASEQQRQPDVAAPAQGQEQGQGQEEEAKVWRRERRVQPFLRAFTLPSNAAHDGITASLDRGVLTVRLAKLPQPPAAEPRRIAVQSMA